MVQQICPSCGTTTENGKKFCTYCGAELSEVNEAVTTSGAPPQSQTTDKILIKGWDVSPDRIDKYEKMMSTDLIGAPIITSKCVLDSENGFLIVSDNGFAWRIKVGASGLFKIGGTTRMMATAGKSKWVRWHDVANITYKKDGQVLVELKIRKKGSLKLDKKGNYKIKKWKLTIRQNKGEPKVNFKQRQQFFSNIMLEIFNRNKVETDPPTSDSRM